MSLLLAIIPLSLCWASAAQVMLIAFRPRLARRLSISTRPSRLRDRRFSEAAFHQNRA